MGMLTHLHIRHVRQTKLLKKEEMAIKITITIAKKFDPRLSPKNSLSQVLHA